MIIEMTAPECNDFLRNSSSVKILDVRSPREFQMGHLLLSHNIPSSSPDIQKQIDSLDKKEAYLVYCHSGIRSRRVAHYMDHSGFEQVYHLTQGLAQWVRAGLDLDPEKNQ